jgi:uncharacterized protein YndB with AHSA1/START domain
MDQNIDWTKFRKRIHLQKPMAEVYDSWTTKSRIEEWFLEKADYYNREGKTRKPREQVQPGDQFRWKWNNWDFEEKGEILKANGIDRISFTFGRGGNVHVELKKKGNGTELILTQENIPADEKSKKELFVGCSTGWTFWLANLKAWLEHVITLHAKGLKQEETKDLVNS